MVDKFYCAFLGLTQSKPLKKQHISKNYIICVLNKTLHIVIDFDSNYYLYFHHSYDKIKNG